MRAKHIARDEFKFYCGRTNHHGVCFTGWDHYWNADCRQRYGICLTCVDAAAAEVRRAKRKESTR